MKKNWKNPFHGQAFKALSLMLIFGLSLMSWKYVETSQEVNQTSQNQTSEVTAFFTYYSGSCGQPCPITFVNQSQNGVSYLWDFGDGNFSTEANPTHNYAAAGTYTVKLTVTGITGIAEWIGTVEPVDA